MKTEMEDESDPVYEVGKNKDDASKGKYEQHYKGEPVESQELWQTSNPNKPRYFMSTNITTDAMDKRWLELWGEIENWYGDFTKKETGEQFWKRMQEKFNLTRK